MAAKTEHDLIEELLRKDEEELRAKKKRCAPSLWRWTLSAERRTQRAKRLWPRWRRAS